MNRFQLECEGFDYLGNNGSDGLRYAWKFNKKPFFVESAAFIKRSKLEESFDICGYTSSVSAGCILKPMGLACRFCRTGTVLPFAGMLTAYDIAKQNVFMVLSDMHCSDHPELQSNRREFAYMGQGEPGYSYTQVKEAIKITDRIMCKLGQNVYRHIVATSGVPEMINAYKEDIKNSVFNSRVTMHFSLHATDERETIMPINNQYPYQMVIKQLNEIFTITGEKPCVGIMLFKNYIPKGRVQPYSNDINRMQVIANELNPQSVRLSLCEYNTSDDTGMSDGWNFEESQALKSVFEDKGFEVKLFSSFGKEKNAACGTLGGKAPEHKKGKKWEELEEYAEILVKENI